MANLNIASRRAVEVEEIPEEYNDRIETGTNGTFIFDSSPNSFSPDNKAFEIIELRNVIVIPKNNFRKSFAFQ